MNQAISVELQFFLISVLWGGILLLIYDCLRIFRRLIKHDSFFVALEDLIFWVAASLFIFAMMYKENNGIIRGFSVMGMAIGMVLYHYIFSEFLVTAITKLIRTLISPISYTLKKAKQFIMFLWSKGKKAINFIIRRLKKQIKSVRITLNTRKLAAAAKRQKRADKKLIKKEKQDSKKQDSKKQDSKKQDSKKQDSKKQDSKKQDTKEQKQDKKTEDKNNSNADIRKKIDKNLKKVNRS